MYKLLIEDDEGGKTAVSLIRDEITIGRKEGNTIRLTDRNVSRRHGRIVREDDRVYVEDVEARYGIDKNGDRIDERAEFKEGDVVVIGDYRLTLKPEKKAKKSSDDAPEAPGANKAKSPKKQSAAESSGFVSEEREDTQIMQAMPAKLVVISSNFAGEEFALGKEEMVVGRGEDCDIIIDHRSISSRHAKVVREDNVTYKIVDLNSKNGVKVSGDSYRATILKRGDVLELGHVKFRFVEPGENYVFDPDAARESVPAPMPSPDASGGGMDATKLGLIAGGVAAAVLVVGVMVVFGFGDGDDTDEAGGPDGEVVDVEEFEDRSDEGITEDIAQAREEIEAGNLNDPSRDLEAIRRYADPSPQQSDDIEALLSQVRMEQPFQQHYQDAVDALDRGAPLAALDEVTSIPSRSLFFDRLAEEQIIDEVLDEAIDVGYGAVDDEDFSQARNIANEVLTADPHYEPATDLLQEADEAERRIEEEARAAAEAERQESSSEPVASADPGTQQPSQPTQQQNEPDPGLSAAEAREHYTQAARQVARGAPQEAIDICGEALAAGHTDCHRIMGLAYDRLDDSSNACRHFEQYLATGPSSTSTVESQMEEHNCQ